MFEEVDFYKKYSKIIERPFTPEVSDGWLLLVDDFLDELQQASKDYISGAVIVSDIKEKFGGMRIYVDYKLPDECILQLEKIVSKYEKLSLRTCSLCGDEYHKLHKRRGYWDMVVCEPCYEKHFGDK